MSARNKTGNEKLGGFIFASTCPYVWKTTETNDCRTGSPINDTVLGPLMFLIYINDITEDISSQLRPFADDCLLYLPIKSEQDSILLQ